MSVVLPSRPSYTQSGRCIVAGRAGNARAERNDLDPSHSLFYHCGIWWFGRCGAYSANAGNRICTRLLRVPCSGHASEAGRYALRRLERGQTPRPHLRWREDALEGADFTIIPGVRLRSKCTLTLHDCENSPAAAASAIAQSDGSRASAPQERRGSRCADAEEYDPFVHSSEPAFM